MNILIVIELTKCPEGKEPKPCESMFVFLCQLTWT